ncbi:hypothetical protein ATANTOWER_010817 [Ataeniobius toweri]|uniref:Uncharacterized protein n=1 Tax=Ataeniobius toweri TaxID=208326 RepID=A0ABU7BZL6_9TELE|nr:hypothetical protein [Ataeniobius toweri]
MSVALKRSQPAAIMVHTAGAEPQELLQTPLSPLQRPEGSCSDGGGVFSHCDCKSYAMFNSPATLFIKICHSAGSCVCSASKEIFAVCQPRDSEQMTPNLIQIGSTFDSVNLHISYCQKMFICCMVTGQRVLLQSFMNKHQCSNAGVQSERLMRASNCDWLGNEHGDWRNHLCLQ